MNSAPGLAHQELPTGTADTSAQLGFVGYLSLGTRFEECHCMRGQQGRQGHIHARADAHDNASLELLSGLQCSIESSQLAGQELMRQFHRQGPFEASQPSEGQTSNCSCCCLPAGRQRTRSWCLRAWSRHNAAPQVTFDACLKAAFIRQCRQPHAGVHAIPACGKIPSWTSQLSVFGGGLLSEPPVCVQVLLQLQRQLSAFCVQAFLQYLPAAGT